MKVKHKLAAVLAAGAVAIATLVTSAGPASAQGFSFPVIGGAVSMSAGFFGHTPPPVVHQGWEVVQTKGNITSSNNATAVTTYCTGCTAEAVSFQIILDSNRTDYSNFDTLTDNATSINTQCVSCAALSEAFQWVVMSPGQITLTPQGQNELAQAHAQLGAMLATYPPGPEFDSTLHNVVVWVGEILSNEENNEGYNLYDPISTPNADVTSTVSSETLVRVAQDPSPCPPATAEHCFWMGSTPFAPQNVPIPNFCQASGLC